MLKYLLIPILSIVLTGCSMHMHALPATDAFCIAKGYPGNTFNRQEGVSVDALCVVDGHDPRECYQRIVRRGVAEFDISFLAGATVDKVTFQAFTEDEASEYIQIYALTSLQPSSASEMSEWWELFSEMGYDDPNQDAVHYGEFPVNLKITTLNQIAVTKLQQAIDSGQTWFAIGLRWMNDGTGGDREVDLTDLVLYVKLKSE